VGVGEGDEVTWVWVAVFEEKARALAGIAKGVEVYGEGRLSLNAWTGRDGAERTGLSVSAWQVMPLGQIGRRKPKGTITR
jgi:single-stranded DNA-binding protein